jgi:mannose-6-phosphate isomerase-like protein (cupin superfamily)
MFRGDKMRFVLPVLFLCLAACMTPASRASGVVVSPADGSSPSGWTDEEKSANLVLRSLRQSPEASFHLLRVRTELTTRVHKQTDLVMVVVAGQVEIQLGDRTIPSAPGDVIEVPRTVPFGVRNKGREPGVLYLIYTPALDPNDVRMVTEKGGESSWKWNLWTQ